MTAALPSIEELPRQNASQVKNKWGEVVRQVRQNGSVAITNHSAVEMVLLDAATYQQLTDSLQALQARVAGAYMLDSDVRDFQAEYAEGKGVPAAHVTIIGRLIRISDRALVDTISASATRDAADNKMGAVAAAFEAAAHQVAQTLARDVAAAVARDRERILAIPTPPSPDPPPR